MRHRQSGRQLNRNSSHRKAMFKNMSVSLFDHELIKTTLPKAKELRRKAEKLITLAKNDSVANRRLAFSRLRDKDAVAKLFCVADIIPRNLADTFRIGFFKLQRYAKGDRGQDGQLVRRVDTLDELGPRYKDRAGGYTRILKCGFRSGDKAPMAYIELVDRPAVETTTETEAESAEA